MCQPPPDGASSKHLTINKDLKRPSWSRRRGGDCNGGYCTAQLPVFIFIFIWLAQHALEAGGGELLNSTTASKPKVRTLLIVPRRSGSLSGKPSMQRNMPSSDKVGPGLCLIERKTRERVDLEAGLTARLSDGCHPSPSLLMVTVPARPATKTGTDAGPDRKREGKASVSIVWCKLRRRSCARLPTMVARKALCNTVACT
mgnify:CR=1 FL=1